MLDSRDCRAVIGRGSGRDENMTWPDAFAARQEPHRLRIFEHGAILDELHLVAFERGRIGQFKTGDFTVLIGNQRCPVERRLAHRPSVAGGILEFVRKSGRIDQQLLRHAAADDAGAADAEFLGDHYARAVAGRDARGAYAPGPGADDEQVDGAIRHAALFARPSRASG